MTVVIHRALALAALLTVATITVAGCAPNTLELPPIANPNWP